MAITLNTNVAALFANRALFQHTQALNVNFERLSTGLRINSAADDAAGLAISNRLLSQINGSTQAARNVNDGLSLVQTADAAFKSIEDLLQKIRTEAVKAATTTATPTDRAASQKAVDSYLAQIQNIATGTSFNTRFLLNGSFTGMVLHAGPNANQTITLNSIRDARTTSLGLSAEVTSSPDVTINALASGDLTLNGTSIRAAVSGDDTVSTVSNDRSAIAKAKAINDSTSTTGVTATVGAAVFTGTGAVGAVTLNDTNVLTINGVQIGTNASPITVLAADSNSALRNAINASTGITGVVATLDSSNRIVLTAADGRNIRTDETGAAATGIVDATTLGDITLDSDASFTIGGTTPGNAGFSSSTISLTAGTSTASINMTTQAGANSAISAVDRAIRQTGNERVVLGGRINSLDITVKYLDKQAEILTTARGRIVNADIAEETLLKTRNQLLIDSATAVLAQAFIPMKNAVTLLLTGIK